MAKISYRIYRCVGCGSQFLLNCIKFDDQIVSNWTTWDCPYCSNEKMLFVQNEYVSDLPRYELIKPLTT